MGSSRRVPAGDGIFPVALDKDVLYNDDMSSYTISYKSNNNVVYSCKYHVVWCPKYRRGVLVNGVDARLKDIIQSVCAESRAELLKLEVMPDHVHLLVEVDPQYGIHRLVRQIKGRSSRFLRQEYPWLKSRLPSLWTNSYFVSTVGGAPLEVIKQYIEHQKRV
jgi:REP-associated tyrosine transposase